MQCNNSYMSRVDYVTCESLRAVSFPPCAFVIAANTQINDLSKQRNTLQMCFQKDQEVIRTWMTNSPQGYKNLIQPETKEYLKSVVFLTWLIEVWPLSLETIEISHKIQLKSTYRDQWNTKPIKIHLQRNLCRCLAVLSAESLRELEYRLFRTKFPLYHSIHLHESKASVTVTSNRKLDAYLRSPGLSVGNKLCFCACIRLSSF